MPVDFESAVDAYVAAWNEPDAATRARLLADAVAEDFEFHGPTGTFRGRESLDGLIVAIQTRLSGATVARVGPVKDGVFGWAIVTTDGSSLVEGTDEVKIGADGRLQVVSVATSL